MPGMQCIRADEELVGGIIHKPMFERLLLCEYAVADLSMANPNVYYELGIRHATRPWSTVLLFGEKFSLPFDVAPCAPCPTASTVAGPHPATWPPTERRSPSGCARRARATTDSPRCSSS